MRHDPHKLVEGCLLAGFSMKAKAGASISLSLSMLSSHTTPDPAFVCGVCRALCVIRCVSCALCDVCGWLEQLPSEVIAVASKKSHELEESVKQKAERRNTAAVQKLKDLYDALSALKATEAGNGDGHHHHHQQQQPGHAEGRKEEIDDGNSSNSWHTRMAQISSLLGLWKSQAT